MNVSFRFLDIILKIRYIFSMLRVINIRLNLCVGSYFIVFIRCSEMEDKEIDRLIISEIVNLFICKWRIILDECF